MSIGDSRDGRRGPSRKQEPPQRRGEPPGRHFRSERCFVINGAWYVATREGIDVGPYPTRAGAEIGARNLIAVLAVVAPEKALPSVREFARRRGASL